MYYTPRKLAQGVPASTSVPTYVDWVDRGKVTPIKGMRGVSEQLACPATCPATIASTVNIQHCQNSQPTGQATAAVNL